MTSCDYQQQNFKKVSHTRGSTRPHGVILVSPGGLSGGGGIGSVTRAMTRWIKQHHGDIKIDVLDPRGEGSVLWSPAYLIYSVFKLIYLRVFFGHDILHIHVSERMSFPRKGALILSGKLFGMKIVLHHHGAELLPFYRGASAPMKRIVEWTTRTADLNIVLGTVWHNLLIQEMGLPSDKVVIRFNASDDLGHQQVEHDSETDPWHFLIVANLSRRKGVDDLLQSLAELRKAGHPAKLTLAGGGQVDHYRALAASMNIGEHCSFTGWVSAEQVHSLMKAHSALVLPSYQEGFPMSIIEALSAGLPVVATPVGSIPELLADRRECLLIEPGNITELNKALTEIAIDDALRKTITMNGRKFYDESFHIDAYMELMMETYCDLQDDRYQISEHK